MIVYFYFHLDRMAKLAKNAAFQDACASAAGLQAYQIDMLRAIHE